ncbi:MAG: transglycosylase domain-containing protein, partial [Alphaproteobacteria bacterium]|nr:transglycosylase domain-containing protein [Alphaproteobacteria bacterium]
MVVRSPRPAAKPETRRPPTPPPPRRRSLFGRLFGGVVMLGVWGLVAVAAVVGWYAMDLPDLHQAAATTRRPSITLLAVDGRPFASFGEVHGRSMPLAAIPKALPEAVLATEDRRFYSHFGLDPVGLARAMMTNLKAGRVVQGGSTITQQLAKNLFLTPERSLKRKVQELLMALWLERAFTKEQILTLYLNRVYFGSGTFGVDAAARRYFDLPVEKLGVYQAAMVAGLLKAPSRYNPLANPKLARQRTEQVLLNMAAAGYLSEAEARRLATVGAPLVTPRPAVGRYFADWLLEQVEDYVAAGDQDAEVFTTLDLDIQRAAEHALDKELTDDAGKGRVGQGAVVVLSPDGAVRAMVGGRDYGDSQFNRATQALRQPGSAFKPFVYLAALEQGLTPESVVEDAPIRLGNWQPGNFDERFRGPIPLREALAQSVNTVAVRLTEKVGRKTVAATAHRLGITTPLLADASLALGTSEVTLLDLSGAYAVLANGGTGVWPHGFSEMRDRQGRILYRRDG